MLRFVFCGNTLRGLETHLVFIIIIIIILITLITKKKQHEKIITKQTPKNGILLFIFLYSHIF